MNRIASTVLAVIAAGSLTLGLTPSTAQAAPKTAPQYKSNEDPHQDYFAEGVDDYDDFSYRDRDASDIGEVWASTRSKSAVTLATKVYDDAPDSPWTVRTTFTTVDHTYKTVRKNGKKKRVRTGTTKRTFRVSYRTQSADDFSLEKKTKDGWRAAGCAAAEYDLEESYSYPGPVVEFIVPIRCVGGGKLDLLLTRYSSAIEDPELGTLQDVARLGPVGF